MNSQSIAKQIRALSLELVYRAQASHIGSALSIADLLAVLVSCPEICRFAKSDDSDYHARDRLILSKGHACVSYYSALYLKGFFSLESLMTYGQDHSNFMNHVSHKVPGVEFSTGALGHGLAFACGKAMAAVRGSKPWHVFVIMSDGELQEGSNWEAMLFANHFNLSNLTACIDYNNLQSLSSVDATISLQPLVGKFISFGWECFVVNGHDHAQLKDHLIKARFSSRPTALILETIKGKGVSFMENQVAWHYKSPNEEMYLKALAEISES